MQQADHRTNLYFRAARAPLHATMALISVPAAWLWSAHSILTRAALGDAPALQASVQTDRNGALMLLSNRHLVLENYAYEALKDATGPSRVTFETALAGTGGGAAPRPAPSYRRMWLYGVAAMGGYAAASELDTIVAHAFPARYVGDPTFDYGLAREQGSDPWDPYTGLLAESRARLDGALAKRYQALGGEIRSYVAYVTDPVAILHARKPSVDLRAPMYLASLVVLLDGIVALVIFMRPKRSA